MSKPIPGKQYTIKDETALSQVAARAYGDPSLWSRIWKANQSNLKSTEPGEVFEGEIIVIPLLSENQDSLNNISDNTLSGKDKDELTIMLDNVEIKTTSANIIRTMDTVADGFTAVMPWEYGKDPAIDQLVRPFGYTPARVYIGNELLVRGLLYGTGSELTIDGSIKKLEAWSFTADIIDSTKKPPYESNNMDLAQLTSDIVKSMGISIVTDDGVDIGGAFDRVTAAETETIFNYLLKLAKQRNLLLSSTTSGDLLFTQTTDNKEPVDVIREGDPGVGEFINNFNGRKRFNSYRAIGKSPGGNKEGVAKDDSVPRSRFVTFRTDETIEGDIQKAAQWKRSTQIAEALKINIPLDSWYTSSGKLWKENTFVTVISPTLHLPNGFDFLIREVQYIESANNQSSILSLVPPEIYTGETLKDPWE